MNILYHHRTQGKGAEGVHIRGIIKEFRQQFHAVFIFSPPGVNVFSEGVKFNKNQKGLCCLSIFWQRISKNCPQIVFEFLELTYNLFAFLGISVLAIKYKPVFIYERYAFFCLAGVLSAKAFKIPIILEVNEISGIKRSRKQIFVKLMKKNEDYVFKNADAILVVSNYLKECLCARGIEESKIHVIANAVNPDMFDESMRWKLRKKLHIDEKIVLGFAGVFVIWDNLELLLETFERVVSLRSNVHLLLVGDGVNRKHLEEIVLEKGLSNKVTFTGFLKHSEVMHYISAMDIGIIPDSNLFGSPIILFELMGMGKPVIVPDISTITDVAKDNIHVLLFKKEDKVSLQKAMIKLIKDAGLRRILGKNAERKVLSEHLWKHNAQRILEIYNKNIKEKI